MRKIKVIKSANTNCYLVDTGNQILLIDTGTAADSHFLKNLKAKINPSQIDLVVLTHGHYDHVGYASILQKEYAVNIAIHKRNASMVANAGMEFPKAKGAFHAWIRKQMLRRLEEAAYPPFHPDMVIEKDTVTDDPNIRLISLPGHTPGSIGVIYEDQLFAGDLVMNMPFPSLSWFAEDFAAMQESLKKIQTWNIQRVYPGHGNDFSGKWLKYIR